MSAPGALNIENTVFVTLVMANIPVSWELEGATRRKKRKLLTRKAPTKNGPDDAGDDIDVADDEDDDNDDNDAGDAQESGAAVDAAACLFPVVMFPRDILPEGQRDKRRRKSGVSCRDIGY